MKKVHIPELNVTCNLVSSYADLKGRNILDLMRTAYMNPKNAVTKMALLRQLFDAPADVWPILEHEENRDQLWRLLDSMGWIWKGPDFRPTDSLRIRGKNWLLPDDNLHQVTTAEFVIATAHLIGFHNAADDATALKSLSMFLATICRQRPGVMARMKAPAENLDPREPFNSVLAEKRGDLFGKVDTATGVMIAQWFNNAANRLMAANGMKGKHDDDDEAAPISQGVFVQDWERQIIRVAEAGVYGNFDQVMARPVADVLSYIEVKNEQIRRQIEANKKQNKN